MNATLIEHWKNLLCPLFPRSAHLRSIPCGQYLVIAVDWKLNTDKERPYKRSRLIRIVVPDNLIKKYLLENSQQKTLLDKRLVTYINAQLTNFNPDHITDFGRIPPTEKWEITEALLFCQEQSKQERRKETPLRLVSG